MFIKCANYFILLNSIIWRQNVTRILKLGEQVEYYRLG